MPAMGVDLFNFPMQAVPCFFLGPMRLTKFCCWFLLILVSRIAGIVP